MDTKLTRDERRRQKDLEEARKLGNAPAEVDEEGKYGCVVYVETDFINSCGRAGTSIRTSRSTWPRRHGTTDRQGMHRILSKFAS